VSEALAATGSATTALLTAETLSFLGQFFSLHPLKVYQAHLPKFVPQIVRLSHDKAQRTSAEAFVVASELARSLRPSQLQPLGEDLVPHIDQLFEAAVSVLDGTLADVDVRVKSLDTLADLLTYEGDVLESQHAVCLNLLKTNVNNETLRLPALRASARVASSQLCQGEVFDAWLLDSLQNVASLLRRGSRSVKVASFECLEALLSRYIFNPQHHGFIRPIR
jgi:cullin-associated NEDD8-dissociated protein 1